MCWWALSRECPTDGCGARTSFNHNFYPTGIFPGCCAYPKPCNTRDTAYILYPREYAQYQGLCTECLAELSNEDRRAPPAWTHTCKVCLTDFTTYESCKQHVNTTCRPRGTTLYDCMSAKRRDIRKARESRVMRELAQLAATRKLDRSLTIPHPHQSDLPPAANSDIPETRPLNVPEQEQQQQFLPPELAQEQSTVISTSTTGERATESSRRSDSITSGWTAINAQNARGSRTNPISLLSEDDTQPVDGESEVSSGLKPVWREGADRLEWVSKES